MGYRYSSSWIDFYYGHDHLYSPVVLYGPTGAAVERYEYDAYGQVQILTSAFSPLTSSQYGNPYYFTGRERDTLDNNTLHLMYYRARTYDPETGRFMQRDPLGMDIAELGVNIFEVFMQYYMGENLYQYVNSDPLFDLDPYGLASESSCWRHNIRYQLAAPGIFKSIGVEEFKIKADGFLKQCNKCCSEGTLRDKTVSLGVVAIAEFGSPTRRLGPIQYRIGWYGRVSGGGALSAYYNPCSKKWDGGGCVSVGGEFGGIAEGGFNAGDWIAASLGGRVGVNLTGTACLHTEGESVVLRARVCVSGRGRIWAKVVWRSKRTSEYFFEIQGNVCSDWRNFGRW